jgi:hypothetical protein
LVCTKHLRKKKYKLTENARISWAQGLIPVIPAAWEAEIGRIIEDERDNLSSSHTIFL